ncbi:MAG: Dihydroorotate dehydrogenase (quinone) [Turneriella sp.]|nr:Dihydroorotate dehydrogenase (quinone) [Turneriella sp.]
MLQKAYKLTKPLLFRLNPERVHGAVDLLMRMASPFIRDAQIYNRDSFVLFDRKFYSRVGVAAGFDKFAHAPEYLYKLGFGFVESGSLTPKPQKGNPRPRLVRIPKNEVLINKMGFNNPGIIQGWKNLRKRLTQMNPAYQTALSLGKGKETPLEKAADDYVFCLDILRGDIMSEHLSYIAINVSSPNTPHLRLLQNAKAIRTLVEKCVSVSPRPIVVKFSPDFTSLKLYKESLDAALEGGAGGVIVTNTTTNHSLIPLPERLQNFGGGLSGKPLASIGRMYLKETLKTTRGKIPVISSGGVFSPEEARRRIEMGADLVQVYTGFIFYGPTFAKDVN